MKKASVFIVLLAALPGMLHAQSKEGVAEPATGKGEIRGAVTDSAGNSLEDASVLLQRKSDGKVVAQGRNHKDGFRLPGLPAGNYRLIISFLSYATDTSNIVIREADRAPQFVRVKMVSQAESLDEIVITRRPPPVVVKDDTIAFNAGAFPTPKFSTVSDLLRKLPGVDVAADGTISIEGKTVDQIYLDGKPFTMSDIMGGTKNLPAEMLAQIQAYDTRSEQDKMIGMKTVTRTKTLNLVTRRDKRYGMFGNAYAGGGNQQAYAVGGQFTDMGKKSWMMGRGGFNNISDEWPNPSVASGGPMMVMMQNGPSRGGIQTEKRLYLNDRVEWSQKLITNFDINWMSNDLRSATTSFKQTFFTDSSLIENRTSNGISGNKNLGGAVRIEYKADSLTKILYSINLANAGNSNHSQDTMSVVTQKAASSYTSNMGATRNSGDGSNNRLNQALSLTHGFMKKGRSLSVNLSNNITTNKQPGALYSSTRPFDSAGNALLPTLRDQQSNSKAGANGYGVAVGYTEPINRQTVVELHYSYGKNIQKNDKESFDYNPVTGLYDLPDSTTSNHFKNQNVTQGTDIGYHYGGRKLDYRFGVGLVKNTMDNDNYSLKSRLSQTVLNWTPQASLGWNIKTSTRLDLSYRGNTSSPTLDQLAPVPDVTNPLYIRIGNPGLKPEFDHSLSINYSMFSLSSHLMFHGGADLYQNKFMTATTLLPGGVQQVQSINSDGNYALSSSLSFGFPFGSKANMAYVTEKIKRAISNKEKGIVSSPNDPILKEKGAGTIDFDLNSNYSRSTAVNDGIENVSNSTNLTAKLRISYGIGTRVNLYGEATVNYYASKYTQQNANNQESTNEHFSCSGQFELPLHINFVSTYAMQMTGRQATLPPQRSSMLNLSVFKTVLNESTQLWFSVFDALNNSSAVSQFTGQNMISTTRSDTRGRTFVAGIVYRIQKLHG